MPAYLSHAIMGDNLYKKGEKDEKIFKSKVDHASLKNYSLGIDVYGLTNPDIHSKDTQRFLLSLIEYVKDHNLAENPEVLALLYGHISHYFFDSMAHPFIYYVEKGCKKVGILSPHSLVEGYIDCYLIKNILHTERKKIDASFFTGANLNNPNIVRLINSTYQKVYQNNSALASARLAIFILKAIEKATKNNVITEDFLKGFCSFEQFLELNSLSREEMVNANHNLWRVPTTGTARYENFLELYDKALNKTLEAINEVNKYLYDGKSITSLENVFPNISYDTGCDLSFGLNMPYTRKLSQNIDE